MIKIRKGDQTEDGSILILDEDRLCFQVLSQSRGAKGLRTISKQLLEEFIEYEAAHPNSTASDARQDLSGHSDVDKFEYGYCSTLFSLSKLNNSLAQRTNISQQILPLQQIFYGAPGTGKSHWISNFFRANNVSKDYIFRTTFHPDSDYSTFVGAYKPTMEHEKEHLLSKSELISELTIIKTSGITYPAQKFGAKYWYSLKRLNISEKKDIVVSCGMSDNFSIEVDKGVAIGEELLKKSGKSHIVYKFIPQVFLRAYVQAYKNPTENVFLVIEEINRGNCAQIFGDLFQLLDRNDFGFSDYPIKPDTDIQNYIIEVFKDVEITNVEGLDSYLAEDVKTGEILLLPSNLHIWATMNTSDQSLFPIDSAFKRRWDWKYVPIAQGYDENGKTMNWVIEANGNKYDWWSFLEKINAHIGNTTLSEDKKLGYFFCKANNGVISADTFVSKVIFYLWNDVFKDYGFEDSIFKDEDGTELSFGKFYKSDVKGIASVQEDKVELFLNNLEVKIVGNTDPESEDDNEQDDDSKKSYHDYLKSVTFDDEVFSSEELTKFEVYTKSLQKIGLDKVVPIIEQSKYKRLNCPLASKQQYDAIIQSKPFSYVEIDGYQFVKGVADETLINVLNEIKDALNLSFSIQIYN